VLFTVCTLRPQVHVALLIDGWQADALHSLAMTRLLDRLGPVSLLLALLAVIVGYRLTQSWVMPALGAVAAALAWPGLRKQATIATTYNRSTSTAGMVLGAIAIGFGALKLASMAFFYS
jgi:hypothetical protein